MKVAKRVSLLGSFAARASLTRRSWSARPCARAL